MRRMIGVGAVLLLLAAAGCTGQGSSQATVTVTEKVTVTVTASAGGAAAAAADTFDMSGELELIGDGNNFREDGDSCLGTGGYDDIAKGAPVTIYDSSGKIVGLGSIYAASYSAGLCTMEWSANDIPAGQGPYQYEISHRGKLTITEDDARAGNASASIGS